MRKLAGFFLSVYLWVKGGFLARKAEHSKVPYTKPTNSPDELISKLRERGLIIQDHAVAENALRFIGYYRLRGYFYPYYRMTDERVPQPVEPKHFLPDTTIEQVISLYEFDRRLRLIILEQIQKVEVALRTCLSEHMSGRYGPHWFMNLAILRPEFDYDAFFKQISSAKEVFIQHYSDTYSTPVYPPSWMVTEVMTFGSWSSAYAGLSVRDQREIARMFSLNSNEVLGSWFHTLSHLRNLCAHHNRIWNRHFQVFAPMHMKGYEHHFSRKNTLYCRLAILKYLSDQVSWSDGLKEQLDNLMAQRPDCVTWEKMGFMEGWRTDVLWTRSINPPA
ncbi:Abi family protein [Pantoea phytobeneficialis]|uniref:Abi family protein n=1 Tax=Pantoea phytobeneficialis TaxID=2052056 RepID=A0AAP9HB14_9GAMM|nr:Abi family protein [Pantoea phytobeneficialis]MDO6409920.1 Abi family protein [Pantoea phytobeneficialis]QGR09799.1 hypothetical protein CTZ24_25470 [Pantoea phytobeneficialis]